MNYVAKQRSTQGVAQDVAQGVAQETSSKYEKQILELVKNNDKVTREEIAQKIGVSKKTIEREIKKIKNLSYIGSGYSGHWKIQNLNK
ncbi:MAG: HTH domain-containing protein [Lachnospiraceae bacterium]|nr:HTH domain-containing protein [Lachnospiraceae bacterium]